jgi:hypothetical protein
MGAAYAAAAMTETDPPANHEGPVVPAQLPVDLRAKGPDTVGHETNLARAPLWQAKGRAVQLDLLGPTVLYSREFRQVAGPPLTLADQRLFAEFTTEYLRAECPEHRRLPFSLGEGARLLGAHSLGGNTRQLVQASLTRLRSCTIKSAVRYRGDDGRIYEDVVLWGLLDSARTTTRGGGRGTVTLSEQVAELLQRGSITLLHAPTWDTIAAEDELAARLWCFLEAEDLPRGWNYQLFAAPLGETALERNLPAIAELLRIDQWSERRRVAQRVRAMCEVISAADPRYQLDLAKGKNPGMWRLEVGPRGPHRAIPLRGFAGLSRLAMGAWQAAYGDRKPSKKQVVVLRELTERLGASWVAGHLTSGQPDPFASLLTAAGTRRNADLRDAVRREGEWARQKAAMQGEHRPTTHQQEPVDTPPA